MHCAKLGTVHFKLMYHFLRVRHSPATAAKRMMIATTGKAEVIGKEVMKILVGPSAPPMMPTLAWALFIR